MKPYFESDGVALHLGDCREVLPRVLADASVDAIVTDPPYELAFMGRGWDASGVAFDPVTWRECLRVAKPGTHMLAFGGTRTWHRVAAAIEDAGWEIRDTIMWIYGSGFPKSLDVSKAIDKAAGATREVVGQYVPPSGKAWNLAADKSTPGDGGTMGEFGKRSAAMDITAPATEEAARWSGWGTALKPGWEPIILARKPLDGTVAANVQAYGTGGLNIGACRVEPTGESRPRAGEASQETRYTERGGTDFAPLPGVRGGAPEGRWPSNLVFTHLAREWYSLKGGIPLEVCQAIYAYYGINETLPALREGNSGNAVRAGQAQILQQGLRWGEPSRQAQDGVGSDRLQDVRDNVRGDSSLGAQRTASLLLDGVQIQGAPSGSDGEGPHSCSSQKDGGCRDREVPPGELFPVERRQASQERLHLRHDRRSSAGQPSNGSAHDEGQVHCRASHCGCDDRGTSAADRRSGSPCERREVGQPPRESDCDATCGPLDGASRDRASFQDASRGSREVAHGERRLEVAAELIPPGWLKYFDYLGTLSACVEGYECDAGCSVAELDRQSAGTRAALPARSGSAGKAGAIYNRPRGSEPIDYGDRGGASRFFPVFRYEAKAPASERPKLPDGTAHATVKPLDLVRWLARLITPPDGLILDPFGGSGTTAEAALIENFRSVLVELEPAHAELIKARLSKPIAPVLDLGGAP